MHKRSRSIGRSIAFFVGLACCGSGGTRAPAPKAPVVTANVVTTKAPKLDEAASHTITAPPPPTALGKPAVIPALKAPPPKDPFGVAMLNPTKPAGRTWFSKWTTARTLKPGQTDALDPEFQNRGDATFEIKADGTATTSGGVMRHYIWDQKRAKTWRNVELTFYAMRVAETNALPYSGFIIEVRTDDGHVDDPVRQCAGASYAMAMYYEGSAELKKEGKHPIYSKHNPSARIWPAEGPVPRGAWIGFKATVRDVAGGVELVLYRDETDGASGGNWTKVVETTDRGGWVAGDGAPLCGHPADRVLTGAFPVLLLRNDNATMRYKKLSVREID